MTEVATFRSDLAYSDGRHPDAVRYTQTAEEDVQRRDFTINGLLLDPLREDGSRPSSASCSARSEAYCRARRCSITSAGSPIWMRAWCAPSGVPEQRFEEDHLRMLRGVRFAARFGFELEAETQRAIRSLAATHSRREPRARARRADEDADRGPCARAPLSCWMKPDC